MPRSPLKKRTEPPFRIKDLSEITGFSREAIRFYINEGLLPPPVKSARNMGWYSQRHIELLEQIRKLQYERFLPLKAIKVILKGSADQGFTETQARALDEIRRKLATERRDLRVSDDPAKLAKDMGLSRREQKELQELGLAASGTATISDVEVTMQWIAIRDAGMSLEHGFSPRDLELVQDAVKLVLERELEIFRTRMKHLDVHEAVKIIDVAIPAFNRIFSLLHERRVAEFIRAYFERHQIGEENDTGVKAKSSKPQRLTVPKLGGGPKRSNTRGNVEAGHIRGGNKG